MRYIHVELTTYVQMLHASEIHEMNYNLIDMSNQKAKMVLYAVTPMQTRNHRGDEHQCRNARRRGLIMARQ